MGFNIGGAIAGAITGFMEGGPIGAAAMGVAGGFSQAPAGGTPSAPLMSGDSISLSNPSAGTSDLSSLATLFSSIDG